MTTVLQYLIIAILIAAVLFVLAMLVFGRGEQLPPLAARTSPAQLPASDIVGEDVRKVRFSLAVRGYRMSDVDWTLERLAGELDRTRQRLAELEGPVVQVPEVGFQQHTATDHESEQTPGTRGPAADSVSAVNAGPISPDLVKTAAVAESTDGPARPDLVKAAAVAEPTDSPARPNLAADAGSDDAAVPSSTHGSSPASTDHVRPE